MASGLNREEISDKVYELLGYCPVSKRVLPGLIAESTMPIVKDELMKLLVNHGVETPKAQMVRLTQCMNQTTLVCIRLSTAT